MDDPSSASSHLPSLSPSQQISHFLLIHVDTAGYGGAARGPYPIQLSKIFAFENLSKKKDGTVSRTAEQSRTASSHPIVVVEWVHLARGRYQGCKAELRRRAFCISRSSSRERVRVRERPEKEKEKIP
jgi:hypothetical protein